MKSDHKLWYAREASAWTEALPIGNGRMGAMVFGGMGQMRFQLNEDTLWTGYPRKYRFPGAKAALNKALECLSRGEYSLAQDILERDFSGPDCQSYMPMGDLYISLDDAEISEYSRELDIERGVARVACKRDGKRFTMECFASHPDSAIIISLASDTPFDAELSFECPLKSLVSAHKGVIMLDGLCPNSNVSANSDPLDPAFYPDDPALRGISFRALASLKTDGKRHDGADSLRVTGARSAVVRLVARSSFAGADKHPQLEGRDEASECAEDMTRVESMTYQELKSRHESDFSGIMNRVDFSLGAEIPHKPTGERLGNPDDRALIELIFQFGRYLMVSASRPGSRAMNLQGIWNESVTPPWHSDYTVNINTEMNYWPAEPLALSDMHEPLFALMQDLRKTGSAAAQELYGAGGMVAHHNIDIWAHATPVSGGRTDIAQWSFWPMSAAWLSRHLFDHYLYTRDCDFLSDTALPVLRDCAQFFADTLKEDENGFLSVSPATSPENIFAIDGERHAVAKSSTMSNAIVRELFENYLKATDILFVSEPLRERVRDMLARVKPIEIGPDGRVLEWDAAYEETEVHHRHVSHLYPLHPAHQITPDHTPALAAAAKKTLEARGDMGTGWSLGWKINFWARLFDGDHALRLIDMQLRRVEATGENYLNGGGTYPNLFDAHPPFQIDGNFGASAGIGEMLLQSRPGEILILPARPEAWRDIEVSGLRAMNDTEVAISAHGDDVHIALKLGHRPEGRLAVKYRGEVVSTIADSGEYTFNFQA